MIERPAIAPPAWCFYGYTNNNIAQVVYKGCAVDADFYSSGKILLGSSSTCYISGIFI
jgi:hypothetical protein